MLVKEKKISKACSTVTLNFSPFKLYNDCAKRIWFSYDATVQIKYVN